MRVLRRIKWCAIGVMMPGFGLDVSEGNGRCEMNGRRWIRPDSLGNSVEGDLG